MKADKLARSKASGLPPKNNIFFSANEHISVALIGLLFFFAAYVSASGFGQRLFLIPGISIIFWPPAGVFMATLIMNQRQTWPWWIAVAAAELTCNALWFHNSLPSIHVSCVSLHPPFETRKQFS